jgi:hypothetical protein
MAIIEPQRRTLDLCEGKTDCRNETFDPDHAPFDDRLIPLVAGLGIIFLANVQTFGTNLARSSMSASAALFSRGMARVVLSAPAYFAWKW